MKDVIDITVVKLFDLYSSLLPKRQQDIFRYSEDYDLSLYEISQKLAITRQGVRNQLIKAKQSLLDFEQRLGLLSKFDRLRDFATSLDPIMCDELLSIIGDSV